MTFLDHIKIRSEIKARLRHTREFDAAIAFWGDGADSRLPKELSGKDVRIICNLLSGGTNPKTIRALMKRGAHVKRRDDLHAKVYLFSGSAIVGSANFSNNGLGLEDDEARGWIEAGVALDGVTAQPVRDWFERQWQSPLTSSVTEADLKAAQLIWNRGTRQERNVVTVADFDFNRQLAELPLVTWIGYEGWDFSPDVKLQLKGLSPEDQATLKWQIDDGLEIEGEGDKAYLTPGRWVLCWYRGRSGGIRKNGKLWWVCVDKIFPASFVGDDTGEMLRDSVLAAVKPGLPPFSVEDPFLKPAIEAALKKYPALSEDDYEGAWFPRQRTILKPFWVEVQKRYRASKKVARRITQP